MVMNVYTRILQLYMIFCFVQCGYICDGLTLPDLVLCGRGMAQHHHSSFSQMFSCTLAIFQTVVLQLELDPMLCGAVLVIQIVRCLTPLTFPWLDIKLLSILYPSQV